MAVIILGYRIDPAFMAFFSCLFRRCKDGPDWRIEWSNESADMQGNGIMRFGQVSHRQRSEGISVGLLLRRGTNALGVAQKSDKRRHTVLFSTATDEQLERLPEAARSAGKGYIVIKDGEVPLLGEYANAVLVWGSGWAGSGSEARMAMLFDELVRTFILPEERKPVLPDPPVVSAPIPNDFNDFDELVG